MMPYIQGDPDSVPDEYQAYKSIIETTYLEKGRPGFLTIDESQVGSGQPHRGKRAKHGRAIHTEAGILPNAMYCWGYTPTWGGRVNVILNPATQIMLASNLGGTCAVWPTEHPDTSLDGDIGHVAHLYPYDEAHVLDSGEVCTIGILTPHESLPVKQDTKRQFLRVVGEGVYGREPYFTENPLMSLN